MERKEVQQQIYDVLFGIAAEGSIMDNEGRLLGWLGETWGIDTGALDAEPKRFKRLTTVTSSPTTSVTVVQRPGGRHLPNGKQSIQSSMGRPHVSSQPWLQARA